MHNDNMKPLTVYKASAGSGKTFTLATEYIRLVIDNPTAYRTILAVTFTNKATEEMKLRILSQLYGIWRADKASEGYYNKVKETSELPEREIRKRAGMALRNLIHNYNYFRVETIDTFFQSVLRNLARELDLTANLRIGLNDYQVEQQAVDRLIEDLDAKNPVLGWIMDYINENINDDKSWNVIGQIKKFGENIFKDFYKSRSRRLEEVFGQKDFFPEFNRQMRAIRKEAQEWLAGQAEQFFRLLADNGLSVEDFANGASGVCGYFLKLQKGEYDETKLLGKRVLDAMESPEKWVKKKEAVPGNPAFDLVTEVLFDLLNETERLRPKAVRDYKSADLTLRHINQLRLLGSIETKVRALNEEANRFLLSDTQMLLHSLIDGSDSPFIFEKIGTQLEHVMIDEFQDTGTVQWANFKVLLEECMSRDGAANLIVGDVKQSIYRWRSGDWRLLNDIEREFAPHAEQRLAVTSLCTNYRSERNIIAFNNAFFRTAAALEEADRQEDNAEGAAQLAHAYADVVQKWPQGRAPRGRVEVELLPKSSTDDDMLDKTVETVDYLLRAGVATNKIAILVRSNRTIQDIADHFMTVRPDIPLVSDEAFRLDASAAIGMIINALRYLVNEEDYLSKVALVEAYQKQVVGTTLTDSELLVRDRAGKTGGDTRLNEELPADLTEPDKRARLLAMPLFDLAERLFSLLGLKRLKGESAYVCAFFDRLTAYLQDNTTDITAFLEEWDANLHEKTIQSDAANGIRLLTIHKSKGLEFDNVVMPFCDWTLERTSGNTVWCVPSEEPYSRLPLVPVDFSAKGMKGSIYEADYHHEHLQNIVDNLNLLYVAFTRAGRNLFVFGKRGTANSRSYLIEQCLAQMAGSEGFETADYHEGADEKTESVGFAFGELSVEKPTVSPTAGTAAGAENGGDTALSEVSESEKEPVSSQPNVFIRRPMPLRPDIETFESHAEFKQSNKSRDFVGGDEEEEKRRSYINTGNILHRLFSNIRTATDIDDAVRELEQEGVLYDEELTAESLRCMIHKRLETEQVADWFSGHWQLFNECTILQLNRETGKVEEHRPDRVMTDGRQTIVVDFKFGTHRDEYHRQVRQYMELLRQMGHRQVEGYLWYVYKNDIERVE